MKRSNAMNSRRAVLVACILWLAVLPACNDRFDEVASPVWITVTGIEPSSDPFGDVYDSSLGSFMPDTVTVKLRAFVADQVDPTSTPFNTVQITSYRVTFVRTDDGTEVPAGFQQALSVSVEAETSEVEVTGLTVVRADQKLQPPLYYLTPFSYGFEPSTGYTTIACNCIIDFYGHTVGGEQVSASASIGINFADYANG
jgi:hypothetical protein